MFIQVNPNPYKNHVVGDCVIRAITIASDSDWDSVYLELVVLGYQMKDMPSANRVWSEMLKQYGYRRYIIPDTCPNCYTVQDFCEDHREGTYILATGSHVVTVIDGDYYDAWDSGMEVPVYYFARG